MGGLLGSVFVVCLLAIHGAADSTAGCRHNGVDYPPDTDISRVYDEESGGCSGMYCAAGGQIIHWRGQDCDSASAKRKLTSLASLVGRSEGEETTCQYKGQSYPPNTKITSYYDEISTYCYGSYCSGSGQVVLWADLNCPASQTRSASLEANRKSDETVVKGADSRDKQDGPMLSRAGPPKKTQLLKRLLDYYRDKLSNTNQINLF